MSENASDCSPLLHCFTIPLLVLYCATASLASLHVTRSEGCLDQTSKTTNLSAGNNIRCENESE